MKGVVIANCAELGLNWERTSLSMYLEAVTARDPDQKHEPQDPVDIDRLRRFHHARKAVN